MVPNDYMYCTDELYTLTPDVKLMFKTILSYTVNNKTRCNYSEYKLENTEEANTMIKRTISYYMYIDDKRTNRSVKFNIHTPDIPVLLRNLKYMKTNWIDNISSGRIYTYVNNQMTVVNKEYIDMRLPFDKVIKFEPGVIRAETRDIPCINIYLNSPDYIQVTMEVLTGLYHVIDRLDVLTYANMTLSFMMSRESHMNLTDFTKSSRPVNIDTSMEDHSTASGRKTMMIGGVKEESMLS